MYAIIIGGGKVGYYLTKVLIQKGYEVTLIERDKDKEAKFSAEFGDGFLLGDGCDPEVLEEAGIQRADILIGVTGDDQDNLVACEMALRHFKVPQVIARVVDPRNQKIYQKMGIELIVNATETIATLIEQEVLAQEIIPLLSLRRGELEIVEITIPPTSPVIGQPVRELGLPPQCVLAALLRGEHIILPRGDTIFFPNDHLLILTNMDNVERLKKLFYT
ncbi:MAG: NAD-binding protein [Candidatus Tectomicrobia bacterium]|uniref:Trk system potassium uptake protein TrkA n=1 Tax=Tectimicrobiota bacterium TaxID=2528274 RepID=A0A932FVK8_UNCTE|nr:NAD-binding protein [Candidatus Tectomicrobia bacterium]